MSSVIEKDIALADLAEALDIAKRAEDDAKLHRLKVEERILDLEPEAQRILDRAITSKPAKTTVNVKRVD